MAKYKIGDRFELSIERNDGIDTQVYTVDAIELNGDEPVYWDKKNLVWVCESEFKLINKGDKMKINNKMYQVVVLQSGEGVKDVDCVIYTFNSLEEAERFYEKKGQEVVNDFDVEVGNIFQDEINKEVMIEAKEDFCVLIKIVEIKEVNYVSMD
jgi:hypothetical protein